MFWESFTVLCPAGIFTKALAPLPALASEAAASADAGFWPFWPAFPFSPTFQLAASCFYHQRYVVHLYGWLLRQFHVVVTLSLAAAAVYLEVEHIYLRTVLRASVRASSTFLHICRLCEPEPYCSRAALAATTAASFSASAHWFQQTERQLLECCFISWIVP